MSPPIHTLIDEFKKVVFKKVELEQQDNSLIKPLPHMVNQDTNSNVKRNSQVFFRNEQSASSKKLSIDTLNRN